MASSSTDAQAPVPEWLTKMLEKLDPEAPRKSYPTHELVHENTEAALLAGSLCSKCLPTKAGAKGYRACVGEFFDTIRQRKARGS